MKGEWSFMDISKERRIYLERYAELMPRVSGISTENRVDVVELASRHGFKIVSMDLDDTDKAFILIDDSQKEILGFKTKRLIGVNSKLKEKEMRFAIGHELAHYFLDFFNTPNESYGVFANKTIVREEERNLTEQEMDYFSACLLMPSASFKNEYQSQAEEGADANTIPWILSQVFDVPLDSATKRIEELGLT